MRTLRFLVSLQVLASSLCLSCHRLPPDVRTDVALPLAKRAEPIPDLEFRREQLGHRQPRERPNPNDPATDRPPHNRPGRGLLVHWFRVIGRHPNDLLACELHTRRYIIAPSPLRPPPPSVRPHSANVRLFGTPEQLHWQLLTAPHEAMRLTLVPSSTTGHGLSTEEQFHAFQTYAAMLTQPERAMLLRYLTMYRRPQGAEEPRSPGRAETIDWELMPGRPRWLRPARAEVHVPGEGGLERGGRQGRERDGQQPGSPVLPTPPGHARATDGGRERRGQGEGQGRDGGPRGRGTAQRSDTWVVIGQRRPRGREQEPGGPERNGEATSPREGQERGRQRTGQASGDDERTMVGSSGESME